MQPVVFCSGATNPYAAGTSEEMAVDSGKIELAFGETYLHYSCHWFNIPGDPEQAGGWLDVTTHACPEGAVADPDSAEAADFALACPAAVDGLSTTLELGDGHAPFVRTTGDDGPGRVHFDLPPGTYSEVSVTQDIPANVTGHHLFCATGGGLAPVRETEVIGDIYWLDIEPGATWDCDWYNLESVDEDAGDGDGPGDGDGDGDGPGGGDDDGDGPGSGSDGGGDGAETETGTDDPGATATPAVVTALPDTGSGDTLATSARTPWSGLMVALAAALAALGVLAALDVRPARGIRRGRPGTGRG